jgi:hypothetical protein
VDAPGATGQCANQQLVCELGAFDRNGMPQDGCEALLTPSVDYSLFPLEPGGLTSMTINGYMLDAGLTGGWLAYAGPPCSATINSFCSYELLAVQIGIGSFKFDTLSWADGLIELPKPMAVVDQGEGLFIPGSSTLVASFVVGGAKQVVSSGPTMTGAVAQTNGTSLVLHLSDLRLPFGSYTIESLAIVANGSR